MVTEKDNEITIKKSEFDGLLARLQKLEDGNKPFKLKADRVKEHVAYVRMVDDEIIVDSQKDKRGKAKAPYVIKDKMTGEDVCLWDLVTEKGKKITVNFKNFLNDDNKLMVKIVKQNANQIIINHGSHSVENPDPAMISGAKFNSYETDLEVVTVDYDSEIEVCDDGDRLGDKLKINNKFLNI